MANKKIQTALISVYDKGIDLEKIVVKLNELGVKIISTGGTKKFIEELSIPVMGVDELTGYPSILGGRVKTLHPKIFGGILSRRDNGDDKDQVSKFDLPQIDLVIVDLYPFEQTLRNTNDETEIIEQIDIGGISLIRAAAKNYNDVLVLSSKKQYKSFLELIETNNCEFSINQRKIYAKDAFNTSSHYDAAIFNYFDDNKLSSFKLSFMNSFETRYGENPHQKGFYFGDLDQCFTKLHGKDLSYNNLLDIDAAINLIVDFEETTFAILKHNNACGIASRENLIDCYKDALSGDPVSAFGGVFVTNKKIDLATVKEMNKIFFEIIIAPDYNSDALEELQSSKNLRILKLNNINFPKIQYKSLLNGVLVQDRDLRIEKQDIMKSVTKKEPDFQEIPDLEFANIVVKHTKSNTIVLVKNKQLIGSGMGQPSRVDALKHAIVKAKAFGFDLDGAVMASDAFFPFTDCAQIAFEEGIRSIVQPGGSMADQDVINFCDENNLSMLLTGYRHFKH